MGSMAVTLDARLYVLINGLPHTAYWDDQISLLSDLGKGIGWVSASCWLALRDGTRVRQPADLGAAAEGGAADGDRTGAVGGPAAAVPDRGGLLVEPEQDQV